MLCCGAQIVVAGGMVSAEWVVLQFVWFVEGPVRESCEGRSISGVGGGWDF